LKIENSKIENFNIMSKIAVIKTGGKQYKVTEGLTLKVEKLDLPVNDKIKLETLLIADGDNVEIGKPSLGEKVEASVVDHGRNEKISVIKFKNKVRYKRNVGHRQNYTKILINKI